ncbi:MAG: hypothetical protein ACTILS_02280, partial [Leuconostoc mesenteroides]
MDRLKTNELSLGLDQGFRGDLIDNFEKIQNGIDGQGDALNKQIEDMLGNVPLQDQNEVTQARIDVNGKSYDTLKGREDATQATAETALSEERATLVEVKNARTDTNSKTYASIKERLDNQENSLNNNINDKLSQISAVPETFVNLAALKSKYPTGKAGIFVTADNGHKYIWVNGSWTDSGVYQSVGVADKSIDPIKLKTTSVVNNKSGKTYNVLSGNKDLYILNEPISEAGIVNVTGKFSSGTVYLYLLKKHSDKFIVIEKSVITVTEGWQSIFTNFYAEGGGDEYIGVLGSVYYAYEGGTGFYNYSSADNTSTEFITNQLVANSDFSLFTTIENSKLANVIDKKANELGAKIPINQFKNGIKDLSEYSVAGANTTYVFND